MKSLIQYRAAMRGLRRKTFGALCRYPSDHGGNTVIVFALSAFVIFGAVGAAVDFSRVDTARKHVQDAADAALLRAMSLSYSTSDEVRKVAADKAFDDNFSDNSVYAIDKALLKSTTGNTMDQTYTVTAKVTSYFAEFIGIDAFDLNVVAKAQSQMQKSEIALVLDSTGSMANDNRMVNLRSSVDTVLASLLVEGKNVSGTKVAIVPFHTQVRIAPGTNYSYINYGTQSVSEGCKSGTNGTMCTVIRDTYNKVCKTAANVEECKKTIKAFSQTYKVTVDGVERTYYNTYMVAEHGGKTYEHRENTYTTTTTTTVTPTTSVNAETGATSTSGSTKTTTTHTLESQSGGETNHGAYQSAHTIKNTCAGTNNTGCFTDVASGTITYSSGYGNGYGGGYGEFAAVSKSQNGSFGGGVNSIWINLPQTGEKKSQWQGCIMDRVQPYDAKADAPDITKPDSLYNAVACVDNLLKPVQGLSDNIQNARTFVSTMVPGGSQAYTNITIGVQWGMEVLSPSEPFTGGVNFNDETTRKYMIVVTDGENTKNRWWTDTAKIDARTKEACINAKARGITVFVVKVMEGNSTLLRECASRPDYFYDLTSASQLNTALSAVFEAIKKTRLTE